MRTKLTSWAGLFIGLGGLLASPDALNLIHSEKWSKVVGFIGLVLAIVGRSILPGNTPPPTQ